MTADDVARIARGLTKARAECLQKWPENEWMAASEVLGLRIAGNTASTLADMELFDRRSDPNTWGRGQYRLTPLGLAVRDYLKEQDDA